MKDAKTREDLAAFIGALANDLEAGKGEWQNLELDMYLDSMSTWLSNLPNLLENVGGTEQVQPSWA